MTMNDHEHGWYIWSEEELEHRGRFDLSGDFTITFWVRRNTWWHNWKQYTPPYTTFKDHIEVKSNSPEIIVPPEVGSDWTLVTIRRNDPN